MPFGVIAGRVKAGWMPKKKSQPDQATKKEGLVSQEKKFGHVEFTGKDVAVAAKPFDRLAISGRGELLLLFRDR